MTAPTDNELYERAVAVSRQAYAPYSRYLVGAVVLAADGRVFEGVNVENAAYPLGVCAERAALSRAATEGVRPGDVAVVAISASPCGGCRQWLHEFRVGRVVYPMANGGLVARAPGELLPDTWEL